MFWLGIRGRNTCLIIVTNDDVEVENVPPTDSQRPPVSSVQPNLPDTHFPEIAAPITENENSVSREPSRLNSSSVERNPHFNPVSHQEVPKLEDFDNLDDLKRLTVTELKMLLSMSRVDFRGCFEKSELLEKVNRLWDDKNQQKDIRQDTTPSNELCKICMAASLDCVLLDCGHIASCIECGKVLAECPICRQYVVRVVRTFKA